MKILFDPQIFLHKFGGISRYFVELISELFHTGIDVALPLWKTTNVYFNENHNLSDELIKKGYYNIPKSRFYDRIDFKGKGRLDRFFRQVGVFNSNEKKFIDYSLNNNYDIVHPTHYDSYFLKYIGTKPFVLTIYDMIHEKFPEYFKCGDVANKKEFLARRASAIIAISDSTKADIIKFLKISEEKIHVVHLASSMMRFEGNKGDLNIPGEYILYTGQRWIYKNFEKFIKACAPILISKDLYLVCTAAKFTKVELRLFEELHISRNVIHMNCSDSLLAALYTNAKLFVFPSLYEGFGIP
ncbi:MAG: glycosyltransferase family 4 protein, partial [Bacteroidales bacterium]|nr:glycosyltransferase family 4 protein [Bacteroidales bacterium]